MIRDSVPYSTYCPFIVESRPTHPAWGHGKLHKELPGGNLASSVVVEKCTEPYALLRTRTTDQR